MYFVHSLHGVPNDSDCVAATVQYGDTLNVAFRKGNVFATQFHPEKSATAGLGLVAQFCGFGEIMNLYPAIDLLGGRVVRLRQGAYDDSTVYGDDPVAMAESFVAQGAIVGAHG
jgi:hypothetical protein